MPTRKTDLSNFRSISSSILVLTYLAKTKNSMSLGLLTSRLRSIINESEVGRSCDVLINNGHVTLEAKKLKLTGTGRKAAREVLGKDWSETWANLVSRRFPLMILGFDPDDAEVRRKLSYPQNFLAAVAAVGYGLPLEIAISSRAVQSELVWNVLRNAIPEIIGKGPFPRVEKSNVVDRTILAGLAGAKATSITHAIGAVAASAVGSKKTGIESVRQELLLIGVGRLQTTASQTRLSKTNGSEQIDASFAERVKTISRKICTPPFQGRVAIAQVYDSYGQEFDDAGSLASFKERLVAAAKEQELQLGRLDLPERMAQELRQRSETKWDTDSVHFVAT